MPICRYCHGCGIWAIGDPVPMGPIDFKDGSPCMPCPYCGSGRDDRKQDKKDLDNTQQDARASVSATNKKDKVIPEGSYPAEDIHLGSYESPTAESLHRLRRGPYGKYPCKLCGAIGLRYQLNPCHKCRRRLRSEKS